MDSIIIGIIQKLTDELDKLTSGIKDKKVRQLFDNCFYNTLQTTVQLCDDQAFVITGDIPAMWLRDSSAQIKHYIPYSKNIVELQELIERVIKRQMDYIIHDSYANAFNHSPNGKGHDDITKKSPLVWERKYEIDSLCYPIWIAYQYHETTGRKDLFTEKFHQALSVIITIFKTEQNHENNSEYTFQRLNGPLSDTLINEGRGAPVAYTGMTWSGFRPSDDACQYGYLIPANMMAAVVLGRMEEILRTHYSDQILADEASTLRQQITEGINKYGIVEHPLYGRIYAYETDGLGNYNLMDDANVPSLLSIPYLGYAECDDPIYCNTRRFVLSKHNPYFYEGKCAKGIGSPHTAEGYIWHIGLIMQGLTSVDDTERKVILKTLIDTDADTGFMHEGFDANDPARFTRSWFAWANSLFSELVLDMLHLHTDEL